MASGEIVGLIGPERRRQDHHPAVAGAAFFGRPAGTSGSTATTSSTDAARGEAPPGVHAGRAASVRVSDRRGAPAADRTALSRRPTSRAACVRCSPSCNSTGKEGSLPGELSRGMRQKVIIACGLVRSATTLLFDEPLTGPRSDRHPAHAQHDRDSGARRRAAILLSSHLLAPRRGGVLARHHHGPRPQGGRRHVRGAGARTPSSRRRGRASSRSSCGSRATTATS